MQHSILIFDASADRGTHLRATMTAHLPLGFRLLPFVEAEKAYTEAIAQRVVAAIIVLEPEGAGLSLARELHERNPRLSILCVRYPDTPTFQQALVNHLDLPIVDADPLQVAHTLQQLLNRQYRLAFSVDAQRVQNEVRQLRAQMETVLSQLNDLPGVEAALLADFSGTPLAHWARIAGSELKSVAGLAAGSLSATRELAALLGAGTSGSLIIQEFDEQTIIVARIARQHVLLLIIAAETGLGAIRLTLRRLITQLEPLVRGDLLRLRSPRPPAKIRSS